MTRIPGYRWGNNLPRYEYTMADLEYVRQRMAEVEPEQRYGYEKVIAMIERRLGIAPGTKVS